MRWGVANNALPNPYFLSAPLLREGEVLMNTPPLGMLVGAVFHSSSFNFSKRMVINNLIILTVSRWYNPLGLLGGAT